MGIGKLGYSPERSDQGFFIDEMFFQKNKLTIDDSAIWPSPRTIEFGNMKSTTAPKFGFKQDFV